MISYRAMKVDEWEDAVFYQVSCDCGDGGHDLHIEFERDPKLPDMIFLNFYKKLMWSAHWRDKDNGFRNIWHRFVGALGMLFKGYIEIEETLVLQGEEHIDSFIGALQEGKQYVKGSKIETMGGK